MSGILSSICEVPLGAMSVSNPLDTARCARPGRFRFVGCDQILLLNRVLRIIELTELSQVTYSAISYVWRGNPPDPAGPGEDFAVKGAADADPISTNVLIHACTLSKTWSADFLW